MSTAIALAGKDRLEPWPPQRGVALVAVLIALLLFGALAISLVMVTNTEMHAASNHAAGREALHAADGGIEIATQELLEVADWNAVLSGATISRFADGPASGTRRLADGRTVGLPEVTAAANSEVRPWGANNPRWTLFAFGPLGPTHYVIVWIADDPAENDGDPMQDGGDATNPGAGIVAIRAEAFGARHARKVIEATVRRGADPSVDSIEMLSWREVR
jgi:hypothetical protein